MGRFDGTALYEHLDPRKGYHPEWDTYIFNFGRNEVRNFLVANALYWLGEFHADGLRVDAVASMLYLDYARRDGEWIPNIYGGRENLEALEFIRAANSAAYQHNPGIMMIAEESTCLARGDASALCRRAGLWLQVGHGLDARYARLFLAAIRSIAATTIAISLLAFSTLGPKTIVLPLSHDEVVYGKRSMLAKMPGDRWQQFANLRALYMHTCGRGPAKR